MSIAEQVMTSLAVLTEEQQRRVLEYIQRLEGRPGPHAVDPHGSCADLRTDLPFGEFRKNRQEMWGEATEQEL